MAQTPRAPGRRSAPSCSTSTARSSTATTRTRAPGSTRCARTATSSPFEQVRPLIGMGGDKLLPELTGLDPESGEAERIGETRERAVPEQELPTLQPTRGARALLEHMLGERAALVVATSAKEDEVHALLEQAGVADLIQLASSADDAERSKPDPDIVQAALRLSGRAGAHA